MGKPGSGQMTSSPSSTQAMMPKKMMGLAPGVMTTSSGSTGNPRLVLMYSATASLSSGIPPEGQ